MANVRSSNFFQDDEIRPNLPERPVNDELMSPSTGRVASNDNEPLMQRRKPVLPPRSSRHSLDKRSFGVYEMEPLQQKDSSSQEADDTTTNTHPPKAFRKTHRFLGRDLGYWRMPVRHLSIFIPLVLVTIIPIYYMSAGFLVSGYEEDDAFSYDCYGNSGTWSFVGISFRFGRFTYGRAKAIDLAWNWIVGRGLQGILTFIAYRVFNDALLRAAEMTPLSYELYASLSLYSTKPDIIWQLLKGLGKYGNWRVKAIFVWLLISTLYLVAFPSLLDACSGYEATITTLFEWPNKTTTSLDDLGNWALNYGVVNTTTVCATWNFTNGIQNNYTWTIYNPPANYSVAQAYEECARSSYDKNSGSYIREQQQLYYWTDTTLNNSWWDHFNLDPYSSQEDDWSSWNFWPTNSSNYQCVTLPNHQEYQWGFSFGWLFVTTIINSVWLFGLWVLWLDCDTNSELCRKGRRLGLWRAVADISEAMREELGPNICAYSEKELAEAMEKRPPIRYQARPSAADGEPGHIGLSSRSSGRFKLQWDHEYGSCK